MEEAKEMQKTPTKFFLKNLKWYEHLAAGWPLIMLFLGGVVGGVCGAMAYFLNGKIFNSKLSKPLKFVFSFLIGLGAILVYLIIVVILVAIFPGLRRQ